MEINEAVGSEVYVRSLGYRYKSGASGVRWKYCGVR